MRFLAITGARRYPLLHVVDSMIGAWVGDHDPLNCVVIHGGASGVDTRADQYAKKLGVHTMRIDALWNVYPGSAGHIRNDVLVSVAERLQAEVFGFWDGRVETSGTLDALTRAYDAVLFPRVWGRNGNEIPKWRPTR